MIKFLSLYRLFIAKLFTKLISSEFLHFGRNSLIFTPFKIQGSKNIHIDKNVIIASNAWIAAKSITLNNYCELVIEEGVNIGNYNHIYCTRKIHISKNVLTADRVYITDNLHNYYDIDVAIKNQPIKQLKDVYIGEGTWLGENVCIIGASIGRNCVVGANSVVTKDFPDFCVIVGAPARIIKKYDLAQKEWINFNNS